MTRDRSFYRQFFTLCLTLMAERLVVCSVNLLDNIMLGSYAETAMAAAAPPAISPLILAMDAADFRQ